MIAAHDLIDVLPGPVVVIGSDERIAMINPAGRTVLGTALTGRHYISALRQPSLLAAVESVLKTGVMAGARYSTKDDSGNDITYVVSITRIQTALVLHFEDLTDRHSADQMRRDFVANVSHELRTPLTALMGFIETMLRGPAKDDPVAQERFLTIMEAEAGRMNRLVGDLMSLNRVETQERLRPTDPVDLGALLGSVAHGLTQLADEAQVKLEVRVPEAEITVPGDDDQLRQVVTNLIENAIKYGCDGGKVMIALLPPSFDTRLRREVVEIVVRDYGPGIDPVHLPRLTERFYRIDTHRSREQGGTGLGLAIVKHIANRHRGRLHVESELGQGSSFSVILPI
ncbi:MAG: ATP-binding protein [Marinovum sp.]|nr:ATP-binding protein [Marinovum sp.]